MAVIEKKDLHMGRLLNRYKRFLADVELEDGSIITAHCTNTGSMKSCWESGDFVLLEHHESATRKLKYTWLACQRNGHWVGVETGMPNRVVAAAALLDHLPGLPGLKSVVTEQKYGHENSRIDVLASDQQGRRVFIEIKNTTLKMDDHALFPDAITERGTKHLRELQSVVKEGHRAAIVFFIHRTDVQAFDAGREIDLVYGEELDRAANNGVEVLPLRVDLSAQKQDNGLWCFRWNLVGLFPWIRRDL